jgi:hypothetical protein
LFGSRESVGNVALHIAMPYVLDENEKIYFGRIKLVVFEMNKNMSLASYELPTEFYQQFWLSVSADFFHYVSKLV